VKLTNSETAMAKAIVRPKLARKRPTMPPMKATGRKTASSDRVVARTARPISRVARMAAGNGLIPFSSIQRWTFSRTTMASSMTMPTERARASRVRMLRVKPTLHISEKVPTTETGMAMAAMTVDRMLPRKTSTTMAARMAPMMRCSMTASALVRIDWELSRTTSRW
jgi:hypothetical protein